MNMIEKARVADMFDARRELLLAPFVFQADYIVLVVRDGEQVCIRLFAAGLLSRIGVNLAVLHCEDAGGRRRIGGRFRCVVHRPAAQGFAVEDGFPRRSIGRVVSRERCTRKQTQAGASQRRHLAHGIPRPVNGASVSNTL
jgi:hypothetical protein